MTELQQTRYDRLMRRVGGLLGPGSKVSEVLSEIFPTVDVERVPGELLYLSGTKVAYGGTTVSAAVALFSQVQIFNPVGSGKLLTVTRMVVSVTLSNEIRWDVGGIALAASVGNQRVRDTRVSVDEIASGQIRTAQSAVVGNLTGVAFLEAADPFTLEDENGIAVLAPGSGLVVGTGGANVTIRVTYYWREREALDSELNF